VRATEGAPDPHRRSRAEQERGVSGLSIGILGALALIAFNYGSGMLVSGGTRSWNSDSRIGAFLIYFAWCFASGLAYGYFALGAVA
jgi:hypothetical protein